jgi:two-component system, cell cycle sensor histidine kinase and response regulator CckA
MDKVKVLIVEDEKIVALDMRKQLEKSGYEVCGMYSSGEEALSRFENSSPDLVLMDIQLQGKMDGVDTAGEIKKRYNTPVIFLTAYADEKTVDRAKIMEPFGYITKPFEERALRTTIEMALYKSSIDKKLVESEEKYRSFFEEDLSGDFIFTAEGMLEDCNNAFIKLLQYPDRTTALATNVNSFFPDEKTKKEFWDSLKERQTVKLQEYRLRTFIGGIVTVLANVIGSFHRGRLEEGKGYLIDITKRKELEEQLRHAQKMEAVGRLAGGVAHDFNNILTVLLGYSAVLQEKRETGEDIQGDIDNIKSSIQRAVKLTKQLLLFSRKEVLRPQIVNANALIHDLTKMLHRLLPENIRLQFFLDADNPSVFIDPGQLEQVLINLVVNAKDAIDGEGRITINTENVNVEQERSAANGIVPPGNYAAVSVSDTGSGIKAEHLEKIFEPFFTTKPKGEGTGLGLSTVYGIVNQNKGYLDVQSRVGKGTEFILFFREMGITETTRKETEQAEEIPAAGETILIVEDDENVRGITSSMLRRKGYNVLEAKNGGEAILLCEIHKNNIDLLLTDYVLPIVKGDEIARRLLKMIPNLLIVFMTADPDFEAGGFRDGAREAAVVKKPFEIQELSKAIQMTLHNDKSVV